MLNFLIHLHLSMFYVLVTAGSICALWGVGLLVAGRRAGKAAAEHESSIGEQKVAVNAREATTEKPTPAPQDQATTREAVSTDAGTTNQPAQARPTISPLFRSALKVTGYLALIQALLGGLLVLMGAAPKDPLHFVYGIVVLLAVPVAFIYTTGKPEQARRDLIILLIAAVVVAAAAVRAFATGTP